MNPFSALELRHTVASDHASAGLAGLREPARPSRDLVGGRDLSQTSSSSSSGVGSSAVNPARPLLPVIRHAMVVGYDSAVNFFNSHPVTAIQVGIGAALYATTAVGLLSGDSVLFHPANFGLSNAHTGVTASLFLGLGLFDSIRRAYSIISYGGQAESILDGPGDVVRGGRVIHNGSSRVGADGSPKSLLSWILGSRYFKVLGVTVAAIVGSELLLNPGPLVYRGKKMYTPYSLAPALEYASMFLYSFVAPPAATVSIISVLPNIPVIALPWLYCATSVFVSLRECLIGMFAALAAAKVVGLRRSNGEEIYSWYIKELQYWGNLAMDLFKSASAGNGGSSFSGAGRRLGDR